MRYKKLLFCFSDTNSSCHGVDMLLANLTRQHTETLKLDVKDKLRHNCTDFSGQDHEVPTVKRIQLSNFNLKYRSPLNKYEQGKKIMLSKYFLMQANNVNIQMIVGLYLFSTISTLVKIIHFF